MPLQILGLEYFSNGVPIYPVSKDQHREESFVPPKLNWCGVVTRNEEILAADHCDFQEELWNGGKEVVVPLTNWGNMPVLIKKSSHIGKVDAAELMQLS